MVLTAATSIGSAEMGVITFSHIFLLSSDVTKWQHVERITVDQVGFLVQSHKM